MIKIQHKIADTHQREQRTHVSQREAELTRDYGNHSLAFLGLAPENLHYLALDGEGLVNFRQTSKAAVVLGDPVCASQAVERVTRSFLKFCTFEKRRVVFYQACADHLASYRTLKLHAFKMGEEAIIHPQTFTLNGSALANVRTSSRRAEREGVHIQWHEGIPSQEVMQQLEYISRAWLQGKVGDQGAEMGFSVGKLVELIDTAERAEAVATHSESSTCLHRIVPRLVTGVVTTSSGNACAFVTFTPIYGYLAVEANVTINQQGGQGWGWALDLMRRSPDAPPGAMELVLVRAIERFRSYGAQVVSLGMVALADTRQELTPGRRRLISFMTDRLGLLETRATLFNFKQKFHPCWESRYLVTNTTFALPNIALSVLRLRNYSGGRLARLITRLIKFKEYGSDKW